MSILSREAAEKLVESGEYRWLTDKETERLKGLGLDIDGDVDPYSGAVVYTMTANSNDVNDTRGIISTHEDITKVDIIVFARHLEIWNALTDEQKTVYRNHVSNVLGNPRGCKKIDLNQFNTIDYRPDREEKDENGVTHYYRNDNEYKIASETVRKMEMERVTALIDDMVRSEASEEEIVKVLKYSCVLLDAIKNRLDYEQSAIDNDICGLELRYS